MKLQLYPSDFVFTDVEKAGIGWNLKIAMDPVWRIDSSLWKSSFSCSMFNFLGAHIFLTCLLKQEFWLNKKLFFSIYSDKLHNEKTTSVQNNSTHPWSIPQIPIPNSLCLGIPESLGMPGAHRLPRVLALLHGGDGGWKQGWKIQKWPRVERISS